MTERIKIAVVGAGHVGSTFAYALATSGLAREVVLVDADRARAEGEAMDIAHAVSFTSPVQVTAGDIADIAGATVTVIAAGVGQRPGETREALLARNVGVVRALVARIVQANPQGMLLMATNPVDTLTMAALRESGLPPTRVFGSGTVLDTARLRAELARHYGVDARNVHAYVLGEHGDSEFVAWSTATLGNVPLATWCNMTGDACAPADMGAIEQRVKNAAYEIIRRKGATSYAIASSLVRIIEAILRDQGSVLTVSTLVDGHYGVSGVCLSLPVVLDSSGIRRVLPIPLSAAEQQQLRASAAAVRKMIDSAGIS